MAEAKWIKVNVSMFRDPKLLVIDRMENSDLIYYVWTSSLLLAGECNMEGYLYISSDIPYTAEMISIVLRRNEEDVKKAYDVLINLGMIEITEDGIYRIKNWDKHQNVESLDKIRKQTRERVARYRERKRNEKAGADSDSVSEEEEHSESEADTREECEVSESEKHGDSGSVNREAYEVSESEKHSDSGSGIREACEGSESQKCINKETCISRTYEDSQPDSLYDCGNDEEGCICDAALDNKHDLIRNVTVTEQNKRENKKENKKQNEKKKNRKSDKKIDEMNHAAQLSEYCDSVTGKIGVLDVGSLRIAINVHGMDNVKKALDRSIEAGKVNMAYINGILKNWKKEGYPEDEESCNSRVCSSNGSIRGCAEKGINYGSGRGVRSYGGKYNIAGDSKGSGEFEGIRGREIKELTEDERNRICSSVI